ncbi:outer membrane protein assembly factor BamE [Dyella monticola]|uniref:Outer membrane protein assembly factor BamE n=1 Tax=Dyella monticola TaxID=1927958 RepID=A0A370WUA1_9GAMM|nr:OmpA family protein [Dyella monticola]RDS79692.1 outer membrane protein assembly factor BamE [Dyella monticola]
MMTKHFKPAVPCRHAMLPWMLLLAGLLSLAGCGNVSHGVAKDGSGAQQLVWPAPDAVTPMHHGGTFPAPAAVRAVQGGMNKQQIAQLIGYPHFEEGVWGVREWNYVFNFRDAGSGQVTVCQFKILFDDKKLARSVYWKPDDCARFVTPPESAHTPAVVPHDQITTLSTDALFKFDRYARADITDGGHAQLDHLAASLLAEQPRIVHVQVVGYTDRLGSDAYNQTLSQRRADTVVAYLIAKHVPSDLLHAEGRGNADPVVQCPDGSSRHALIACLAPNRRVVVRVTLRGNP